jgi:hypothetical protein
VFGAIVAYQLWSSYWFRDFVETSGSLKRIQAISRLTSNNSEHFKLIVDYTYEANGHLHQGIERGLTIWSFSSKDEAIKYGEELLPKAGSPIRVLYELGNAQNSRLAISPIYRNYMWVLGICCVLFVASLSLIAVALKER